jgi:hypothetical protein
VLEQKDYKDNMQEVISNDLLLVINERDSFIFLIAANWPDLAFLNVLFLAYNRS